MARPLPPHTDAGHALITAELVRLCLPHHPSTDRLGLTGRFLDPEEARRTGSRQPTKVRR